MRYVKLLSVLLLFLFLAGCATHAKIEMPVVNKVRSTNWEGKGFRLDVYYSQPQPGVFSGGEQQELKPLSEAQLSVGSAQVLASLPQMFSDQLPLNAFLSDTEGADYRLKMELVAHHKLGPTYPDYEAAKNLAKGLITLGMGADEYNIVADFDVTYSLISKEGKTFQKHFSVKDNVDHERSAIEFKNNTFDFASSLLRKHIMLTSSTFLEEASQKL